MNHADVAAVPGPSPRRWWDPVVYLAVVVGGLAGLIYVFAAFFVRTDGFRALLAREVERECGLRLVIGGSAASWSGDLELRDVRLVRSAEVPEGAGLWVDRIRLTTHLPGLLRGSLEGGIEQAEVEGWRLVFRRDAGGRWRPVEFGDAASWLGRWGAVALPLPTTEEPPRLVRGEAGAPRREADPAARLADFFQRWQRPRVILRHGDIVWSDVDGSVLAAAQGARFTVVAMALPTRSALHYHLQVDSVFTPDMEVRNMDLELLRTGENYLVLKLEADRHPRRARGGAPVAPPSGRSTSASSRFPEEILRRNVRSALEDALRP